MAKLYVDCVTTRGGVEGCTISDGYVTSIGFAHCDHEVGRLKGKAAKWFQKNLGKKAAVWETLGGMVKGLTSSLSESPVLPPSTRAGIAAIASIVPRDAGNGPTVTAPPRDAAETADQIDSLREVLAAYMALEQEREQ